MDHKYFAQMFLLLFIYIFFLFEGHKTLTIKKIEQHFS